MRCVKIKLITYIFEGKNLVSSTALEFCCETGLESEERDLGQNSKWVGFKAYGGNTVLFCLTGWCCMPVISSPLEAIMAFSSGKTMFLSWQIYMDFILFEATLFKKTTRGIKLKLSPELICIHGT